MSFLTTFEEWNNLPVELKQECLKWMDLKTKYQLRSTSKTERRTVNSHKFIVRVIKLTIGSPMRLDIYRNVSEGFTSDYIHVKFKEEEIMPTIVPLLSFLFKNANIGEFYCNNYLASFEPPSFLTHLEGDDYHIKHLGGLFPTSFLERCALNSIYRISYSVEYFFSDELLRHPVINGVKVCTISCLNVSVSECIKMGQKWMDTDAEIGSRIKTNREDYQQIDDYIDAVKAQGWKIVKTVDKIFQIEANNEKKHLLLRVLQDTETHVLQLSQLTFNRRIMKNLSGANF